MEKLREAKEVKVVEAVVGEPVVFDVRVPSEEEIGVNPERQHFLGGGWVDVSAPNVINVYWHRRQESFTVYSLLEVLEHEVLHGVLGRFVDWDAADRLDSVFRWAFVDLGGGRFVFVNEWRVGVGEWRFVGDEEEEPPEDLLE